MYIASEATLYLVKIFTVLGVMDNVLGVTIVEKGKGGQILFINN